MHTNTVLLARNESHAEFYIIHMHKHIFVHVNSIRSSLQLSH